MDHLAAEIVGGVAVGLSLGLVGAGGAILTVPIFGAALGHPAKQAILEAVAVTGMVSAFAGARAAIGRLVDWRRVLLFGIPGIVGAMAGAPVAARMPAALQVALFALLAAVAGWRMWVSGTAGQDAPLAEPARRPARTIVAGFVLGVLTSVLGVGGGFILIPALVLLEGLPMPRAVATSLVVIAINAGASLAGAQASGALDQAPPMWRAVAIVAACGVVGSEVGRVLGTRLPVTVLRRGFATVLLGVAAFMLWRQFGATPS
jgi:uncharacterized membrane protein YfcA